jgi:hypothetical protein
MSTLRCVRYGKTVQYFLFLLLLASFGPSKQKQKTNGFILSAKNKKNVCVEVIFFNDVTGRPEKGGREGNIR